MKIVTDLTYIAQMAQKNDDENWDFRAFLRQLDSEDEELDAIVHRLNDEVSAQIDCTACANCCREIEPSLDDEDIHRFAIGLEMPVDELHKTHLRVDEQEAGQYLFNERPCPFLAGNLCGNYEHRPTDCASFPHLHKPNFRSRLFGVIGNYEICPIVYNVYEQLKVELWPKKRHKSRSVRRFRR